MRFISSDKPDLASRLLQTIRDKNGALGLSDEFWLNALTELLVGVILVGSVTVIIRLSARRAENRLRRYERSSKSLRLFKTYNGILFSWSIQIPKVAELFSITLKRDPKSKEPLPNVLAAQIAGTTKTIEHMKDRINYMKGWFEDNYSIYPLSRHPHMDALEQNVEEFSNLIDSYCLIFEQLIIAQGNRVALGVYLMNMEFTFERLKSFVPVCKRFPELFTEAFVDFPIDTRPMRQSIVAHLEIEQKHSAFLSEVWAFSKIVTKNFQENTRIR